MCTPYNSVIQVDLRSQRQLQSSRDRDDRHDDDDEGPTGLLQTTKRRQLEIALGPKIMEIGQLLGGLMHYHQPGLGHSECLEMCADKAAIMPAHVFYESAWWDRTIRMDTGGSQTIETPEEVANRTALAQQYDRKVCTGDLGTFRQWWQLSLARCNSQDLKLYCGNFLQMLTREVRDNVVAHVKRRWDQALDGYSEIKEFFRQDISAYLAEQTKKRENLVPAWADDARLWVAKSAKMMMEPGDETHSLRLHGG